MGDDVDPQARNIPFAYATIEQIHIVGDFVEQRIKRIVQQFQARNIRVAHVNNNCRPLGRFDASFTNGIFQRLCDIRTRRPVFPASPHGSNLATPVRQAKKKSVSFQEV